MKNGDRLRIPVLLLIASLLFINCSRSTRLELTNQISPPFENYNIDHKEIIVDAEKGAEIKLENGTKISIPPQAFVTKDGKAVSSTVKLKYREFHNSSEILISGIPMQYKGGTFQTAGMFELNGLTENGESIEIAKDKSLSVRLASNVNDGEYQLYYFDETRNEWMERGVSNAVNNTEKDSLLAAIEPVLVVPVKPEEKKPNNLVFDLEVNTNLYPELKDLHGLVWQYSASDGQNNPEKSAWVFTEKWSNVLLSPIENDPGKYSLWLRSRSKEFKTTVSPVLKAKDYQKAMSVFETKMTAYKSSMDKRTLVEEQASREADLLRTFSVNNFGIYNCDRLFKQENVIQVAATFMLDKKVHGVDESNMIIYQLTGNDRAVLTYKNSIYKSRFAFDQSDNNKLVVVLPGNKIAAISAEEFKTITSVFRPGESGDQTFVLRVLDKENMTSENIMSLLASL